MENTPQNDPKRNFKWVSSSWSSDYVRKLGYYGLLAMLPDAMEKADTPDTPTTTSLYKNLAKSMMLDLSTKHVVSTANPPGGAATHATCRIWEWRMYLQLSVFNRQHDDKARDSGVLLKQTHTACILACPHMSVSCAWSACPNHQRICVTSNHLEVMIKIPHSNYTAWLVTLSQLKLLDKGASRSLRQTHMSTVQHPLPYLYTCW